VLSTRAACIYSKRWHSAPSAAARDDRAHSTDAVSDRRFGDKTTLSREDDAKLIFGVVYSLRNISRRLGGDDNRFVHDASMW
jgi:trafficking protein particle complex subunit 1